MKIGILSHFSSLPDPRISGMTTYPLDEILLSVLVGVLCNCEDWEEIALCCEEKLEFLRNILNFENGIASSDTLERVFNGLDIIKFEECFMSWVSSLQNVLKSVIAIDGKTARGSKEDSSGRSAIHIVSAFATEYGLVLGQRKVDGKSNEITAIPELLDLLALDGCTVTMDAMGAQKEICRQIVESGGNYVISLKGNQGTLHSDVKLFFAEQAKEVDWKTCETTDAGHGRVEVRKCTVTSDIAWLKEQHDWRGLQSIVKVDSLRFDKKYKIEQKESRYYISSLPPDASNTLLCTRSHWGVENKLHWSLDVAFNEDKCRTRRKNAATNLAIVRKIAFNLCKSNNEKLSTKKKLKKAGWNNQFLAQLLIP